MNEEDFVSFITSLYSSRSDVAIGIGDDCAALDLNLPGDVLLLAAVDQVVEGIHFLPQRDPVRVAKKLLKRNLSDIAAMGGIPTHALVTVAMYPFDEEWLCDFNKALSEEADRFGVAIIGGDVSKLASTGKACTLSIMGRVEKDRICLRSNAKNGDYLYATGVYGNSFVSEWHLDFEPRLEEARFLAGKYTTAMMDVSDGFAKDVSRLAKASSLACRFIDDPPRRHGATVKNAFTDGEDYELIFAVPSSKADLLEKEWPFATQLSRLGVFEEGTPGRLMNLSISGISNTGFDHFNED